MNVQCPQCGEIILLEEDQAICMKCGNTVSQKDRLILKNPRRGRGMLGTAIIMFFSFLAIFIFYSKFFGGWGMAISGLVWLWGLYKIDMNKRQQLAGDVNQTKP